MKHILFHAPGGNTADLAHDRFAEMLERAPTGDFVNVSAGMLDALVREYRAFRLDGLESDLHEYEGPDAAESRAEAHRILAHYGH